MTNSRATSGLQVVEKYNSAGTFTTKTFTLPSIDDMTNTAYYELYISGKTTAGLTLNMTLNGNTDSQYYVDGTRTTAGTATVINIDAAAIAEIVNSALTGTDREISGTIRFYYNKSGTNNYIHWLATMAPAEGPQITKGTLAVDLGGISSILIVVSTSSMQDSVDMTLYKVLK